MMLKKIQTWLHPFPESFFLNNADDDKGAVYNSWKEELKDPGFWLAIVIFIAIVYLAKHYGFPPVEDIRTWHY